MRIGKRQIVVELDGVLYHRWGAQLTQMRDLRDVEGAYLLISDLQGSMARAMIVEAEPRYVELLVARRLQEAGEFDEPVTVISHWKKKLGRNTTSVLFTAVPTRIYLQYREQIQENAHSVALYPVAALLYHTLKRLAPRKPMALLFQHGRFVDLILGSRRRVYMANRYVAYDTSEEQINALWERIGSELTDAAGEHRIEVEQAVLLNWVDAAEVPAWPPESGLTLSQLAPETLFMDEVSHRLSFFKQAAHLPLGDCISPPMEKLYLQANRLALPFNLAALLLAVLMAVSGLYCQRKQVGLEAAIKQTQDSLARTLAAQPPPPVLKNYSEVLSFAQDLERNQRTPGFGVLMGDLSRAVGRGMLLVDVDARYEAERLTVAVTGQIEAPFQEAHDSFQRFLNLLQARQYTVEMDQFDTQIRRSQFRVKLVRSL